MTVSIRQNFCQALDIDIGPHDTFRIRLVDAVKETRADPSVDNPIIFSDPPLR
jgi:hypothetical protein